MAFSQADLTQIAYGNGFRLWRYKTADTGATVDTVDYFVSAINELQLYDVIIATVDTGGTPVTGLYVVSANDGTNIDVDNITQIGGTDTD